MRLPPTCLTTARSLLSCHMCRQSVSNRSSVRHVTLTHLSRLFLPLSWPRHLPTSPLRRRRRESSRRHPAPGPHPADRGWRGAEETGAAGARNGTLSPHFVWSLHSPETALVTPSRPGVGFSAVSPVRCRHQFSSSSDNSEPPVVSRRRVKSDSE